MNWDLNYWRKYAATTIYIKANDVTAIGKIKFETTNPSYPQQLINIHSKNNKKNNNLK